MAESFTHFDDSGNARMVNVGQKPITERVAKASALVRMKPETLAAIKAGTAKKGDVLGVARIAGIMAAKKTEALIPLCHALGLDSAEVQFTFPNESTIRVETHVQVTGRTGVEMESLVAASTAALTIYDMCKSMDRAMVIDNLQLEEKSGGQSGHFTRS